VARELAVGRQLTLHIPTGVELTWQLGKWSGGAAPGAVRPIDSQKARQDASLMSVSLVRLGVHVTECHHTEVHPL
jgi:hypothetical protein